MIGCGHRRLRLEWIIGIIAFVFLGLETLLSGLTMIGIYQNAS